MRNIGDSLKKKVGPLPIWIWSLIAFVLVWYYRSKFSSGTTLATQSLTPTNALPPQDPVPLAPGESVYDPNSGALVNTPGATAGTGDVTGGNGTDLSTIGEAMNNLADAIASGMTVTTQPAPDNAPPTTTAKPTAAKKRKVKPKRKNRIKKPRSSKPRSNTHVKRVMRSMPKRVGKVNRGHSHSITPAASSGKRHRQRHKTPLRTAVVRQRPVASHPTNPTAHNTPHKQRAAHHAPPRKRRHR